MEQATSTRALASTYYASTSPCGTWPRSVSLVQDSLSQVDTEHLEINKVEKSHVSQKETCTY